MTFNTQPNPKYRSRAHRTERRRLERQMERDGYLICAQPECLEPSRLIEQGQPWHAGHNDEGTGYIGPVHAHCNVVDGAKRARARQQTRNSPGRWEL